MKCLFVAHYMNILTTLTEHKLPAN